LASLSQPVLRTAVKGTSETKQMLSLLIDELRNVMFLSGASSIETLHKAQVVILGKTSEWLKARGFGVASYAKRGEVELEF
jgi:isopentenyl diphosphate isomerase/L-lactate dehydrogenase-like FMN-dependent dehydrogenase